MVQLFSENYRSVYCLMKRAICIEQPKENQKLRHIFKNFILYLAAVEISDLELCYL